jgi:hypothetical protein
MEFGIAGNCDFKKLYSWGNIWILALSIIANLQIILLPVHEKIHEKI